MRKNLEVKARIISINMGEEIARSIPATFERILQHVDTYFLVQRGRLKMREIDNSQAELIYYNRNEDHNHRVSDFEIYLVQDPQSLKKFLTLSLGMKIQVVKTRRLYMYQATRIHLDEVQGLGAFLEFEVPVEDSEISAQHTLNYLINKFGIKEADYIKESYSDMLLRQ
jgi:predicted adenylyl cyclase CyaB